MAIWQPKILTAVTVPSGGWDLDFIISDAATLDTSLTATIPAGTYFVAGDNQSDDLLFQVMEQMRAAILAGPGASNRFIYCGFDYDTKPYKVKFWFNGSLFVDSAGHENDVELTWTTSHTDLAAALGFKTDADDQDTGTDNPTFTADYPHAWGWYATEDGQLEELPVEDRNEVEFAQATTFAGQVKTVQYAERYKSEMVLSYLTRAQTHSRGVAYGAVPVYPYNYNEPLECWWEAAKGGTRFRVYRTERYGSDSPTEIGINDAASSSVLRDSGKSWDVDPQSYKGMVVDFETNPTNGTADARFYISSHTAIILNSPNPNPTDSSWDPGASKTIYIQPNTYETYVVDLARMREWAPEELGQIDKYRVTIPLKRYVA